MGCTHHSPLESLVAFAIAFVAGALSVTALSAHIARLRNEVPRIP